jgi:ABC-type transport system substrate-binding protein
MNSKQLSLIGLIAALLLIASTALVCGAASEAATATTPAANTLQVSLAFGIENLDPARAWYVPDWQLDNLICAKLLTFPDQATPDGLKVQPEVAAAMPTVSADLKTYTFKIRDDFTLSSGDKVTAQSFKAAIDRVASPNEGSPAAAFLGDIVGFNDVVNGQASSVSGVVASGDTLTVTLTRPSGTLLSLLALPFTCALPVSTPKAPLINTFPSAGPYYIDGYTENQSIVLKRNPYYTGPRPRYFDEIDYTLGLPQDQAYLKLLNGQLDYAGDGLPPSAYQGLSAQYGPGSPAAALGRQRYFVNPTSVVDFLALNTTAGRPFADVRLRQAVNYAIDRASLVALRGPDAATATDQYLPPAIPGFSDEAIYPLGGPDVAKAEALIAEAGGLPAAPIVVYGSGSTVGQMISAEVKSNLEAIGFTVDVQSFPSGVFTKCGHKGEPFDICLAGWQEDYPDAYDYLKLFDGRTIQADQNNNISYLDDPAFNAKLDAAQALSGDARNAAFGDLDVELARDSAPWAAYDYRSNRDFFSDRIGGQIYQAPYGSIDLERLYVRPAPQPPPPPAPPPPSADLALAISDIPDPARVGRPLTHTLKVSNPGPDAALAVGLDLTIPTTLSVRSLNASQGSCSSPSCQLGTIPAGASATVTLVTVPRRSGGLQLSATIHAATADPAATNNGDSEPTLVRPALTTVPALRGKTLAAARAAIVRAHCKLGSIRRAYSTRVKVGRAISQSPRAGTKVTRGSKVSLVISRGRKR